MTYTAKTTCTENCLTRKNIPKNLNGLSDRSRRRMNINNIYNNDPEYDDSPDPASEHFARKTRRSKRLAKQKIHENRLRKKIAVQGYKPSIWLDRKTGRVKRAKHSDCQRWIKKHGSKIYRRLSREKVSAKGNGYRRWFDYWYTWI